MALGKNNKDFIFSTDQCLSSVGPVRWESSIFAMALHSLRTCLLLPKDQSLISSWKKFL